MCPNAPNIPTPQVRNIRRLTAMEDCLAELLGITRTPLIIQLKMGETVIKKGITELKRNYLSLNCS